GHRSPNVVKVESGYLNAMGLPNPGVEEFASEMEGEEIGTTVLGSIYGSTPEEFLEVALSIAPAVDGLELNLSCPHAEKLGAAIGADPDLVEEVVSKVAGEIEKPVFAKLTPNVADIKKIGKAAEAGGGDGLVAINTLPGMAIDTKTRRPVLGNRSGGLSGPAIHPVAVKSVYDLYKAVSIPIIGVGGVGTGEDLVELILAGAPAVQVGTAIAEKGLSVFEDLRSYLSHYMDSSDADLQDLVGAAHEF
ncbi:dihydroorotate dehydrogenase, partial [Candidatus Bipolaricaulota bacterium]|nr:dihydroorotate dehydrogenase [Candidatus Bipolaricaulota bacterium]